MEKKALILAGGAVLTVAAAQTVVLGVMGGIGPLGFIRRNKIAKHPGNREEYGFDRIEPLEDSPLKGKHIGVLGSSVFYGTASNGTAVGEYLCARHGCTMTKSAVGGTTLCDISDKSYVSRLKALDTSEHFDVFFVQLSTNDATRGLPLGEIGDAGTDTVTGAMRTIIEYIRDTWHCPVVFITGTRYNSRGCRNYAAMRERLLALREMYADLTVVDLWGDESYNAIEGAARSLYMADGIHPTKAGYRDWWGPEIDRQLPAVFGKAES